MVRAVIMRVNPDAVIVVTDSTYENVMKSKKMVRFARENAPCARIIGIANKQDLPDTLTPEQVEQILQIPTHGLVAIDMSVRERLLEILTNAVLER
jgi:signal recognition particle receptor subunit beta